MHTFRRTEVTLPDFVAIMVQTSKPGVFAIAVRDVNVVLVSRRSSRGKCVAVMQMVFRLRKFTAPILPPRFEIDRNQPNALVFRSSRQHVNVALLYRHRTDVPGLQIECPVVFLVIPSPRKISVGKHAGDVESVKTRPVLGEYSMFTRRITRHRQQHSQHARRRHPRSVSQVPRTR